MNNFRILVVEDDLDIQELIKEFLKSESYEVHTASDGMEGIKLFNKNEYELVILDIMLPNVDGYSVCKIIRSKSMVPIIMLTALDDERDQIKGFDLKTDDYITKPFSFNLLTKRVEAVLRRAYGQRRNNVINFEELKLDCDSYNAFVNNMPIELTTKEFEILQLLVANTPKVYTREVLLDKLWGYDFYGDARVVDTHIKNLRRKLGLSYIKTVKGVGYKIESNE